MMVERVRGWMKDLEEAEALDPVVDRVQEVASAVTGSSDRFKNALSGRWMGHRLHPLATDAVIGPWLASYLLDLFGGPKSEAAADRLVAIGLAAAPPTFLAGWSDWSDAAERSQHRTGLVHAGANGLGAVLQLASLRARHRGHRGRAKGYATMAMAAIGLGGYLGGHLSYVLGTGVDHPTGDLPPGWTPALPVDQLTDDRPVGATVGGVEVVLVRTGGTVHALAATCNHAGGPLAEGELSGDCIVCPWHGSRFRLDDGSVVRAPAVSPQPRYETRVVDGVVEVSAASRR